MKLKLAIRNSIVLASALTTFVQIDPVSLVREGSVSSQAMAKVGRPLTPGSAAGVARRTTRRVIRRTNIYVAKLPAGCVKTSVNGTSVWHCGATYYQHTGSKYVVVHIN